MKAESNSVWEELAALINSRPEEERKRYFEGIRRFKHDLQNALGMISTAEKLMEREGRSNPEFKVDWELLGIIKEGADEAFALLAEIAQFAEAIKT